MSSRPGLQPRSRNAALTVAVACLAAAAHGSDRPQWGGRSERNFVSGETGLPINVRIAWKDKEKRLPLPGGNVRWVAPLGTQTYSSPTVAGGRVFIGTNDERLDDSRFRHTGGGVWMCFDERSGALLWKLVVPRLKTQNRKFNFDHLGLGECSTATVEGDRAFVVSSRGEVLCLDVHGQADGNDGPFTDEGRYMVDARVWPNKPGRVDTNDVPPAPVPAELRPGDGDIVWAYDFVTGVDAWAHDAADCSVLVDGAYLYVCTSNGRDNTLAAVPSPDCPDLIVLDKVTGKLVAVNPEPLGRSILHGEWSSPTLARVGGRSLVVWGGGDGFCYAFDARFERREDGRPAALNLVWRCDANPPHYRSRNGRSLPYNKRKEGPSEIIATPVFHDNRIYVDIGQDSGHGPGVGCLTSIDATMTGDITAMGRVWQYTDLQRSVSSAAVTNGLVFAADLGGVLHCVDASTGQALWTHDLKAHVFGSPLAADGKVYVGDESGLLTVFACGREKKNLATVEFDSPLDASPVAANGTLFVATRKHLYAIRPTN